VSWPMALRSPVRHRGLACAPPIRPPTQHGKPNPPGRDPVLNLNLPVSIHLPPRRQAGGSPTPPPAGAPTAPARAAAAYIGRTPRARGVRWCRARAPRPAPNGAIRERHAAPCLLAPTPRGGGPRGFHSVTNCFVPWGSPSRAPPFCPPLPAGRDRQHACAWSAHGILFSVVCTGCRRGCTARALPHWARTFRAPAGRSWALGQGRASNPGAAHYISISICKRFHSVLFGCL